MAHFSDSGDSSNQEDDYESDGPDSDDQEAEDLNVLDEQLERRSTTGTVDGYDKQNIARKIVNIFLLLPMILSICFGCSKEPS